MRLSFDDEESFKEAAGSLHFNDPPSDPNSLQGVGSSNLSSTPPQENLKNEDICLNDLNPPSDPNSIVIQVQRVIVRSNSTSSTPPYQRNKDT